MRHSDRIFPLKITVKMEIQLLWLWNMKWTVIIIQTSQHQHYSRIHNVVFPFTTSSLPSHNTNSWVTMHSVRSQWTLLGHDALCSAMSQCTWSDHNALCQITMNTAWSRCTLLCNVTMHLVRSQCTQSDHNANHQVTMHLARPQCTLLGHDGLR